MNSFFQKYQATVYQFSRFLGIGFLNAAVDFAVFNILIAATGVAEGFGASIIKACSFTVAVLHSFYWNKYWAFQKAQEHFLQLIVKAGLAGLVGIAVIGAAVWGAGQKFPAGYFMVVLLAMFLIEAGLWFWFGLNRAGGSTLSPREFSLFVTVSVIGALLGASIVWFITSVVHPQFGLNERLWANLANVAASGLVLVWNFTGYKLLVFKK